MKRFLPLLAAFLIGAAFSALVFYIRAPKMEAATAYATAAFVACIDGETVTFEGSEGNQWAVDGADEWELGDLAILVMHDNGTPDDLEDDVILSAEYSGFALG